MAACVCKTLWNSNNLYGRRAGLIKLGSRRFAMSDWMWGCVGLAGFVGLFYLLFWLISKTQKGDRRYTTNHDYPIY